MTSLQSPDSRTLGRFLLVFVIGISWVAPLTYSQESPPSVSELRRENEQLRLRIDELESQLERSQQAIEELLKQVRELNTRVAELQRALGAQPAAAVDAQPAAPNSSDDLGQEDAPRYASLPEDNPFAAPESLFDFVRSSYHETFGQVALPFESTDARNRYLRDLDAWTKSLRRSQRAQIEWVIEVRRLLTEGSATHLEYRVVDAITRLPYSERTFVMQVPSRYERRVLQERNATHWKIRGVVAAAPAINRNRETIGFFDVRPFVGPYVEFGFDLSVNSILNAQEIQETDTPEAESEG